MKYQFRSRFFGKKVRNLGSSTLILRPMVHSVLALKIWVLELKKRGIAKTMNFGSIYPRELSTSFWLLCFVKRIRVEVAQRCEFSEPIGEAVTSA